MTYYWERTIDSMNINHDDMTTLYYKGMCCILINSTTQHLALTLSSVRYLFMDTIYFESVNF